MFLHAFNVVFELSKQSAAEFLRDKHWFWTQTVTVLRNCSNLVVFENPQEDKPLLNGSHFFIFPPDIMSFPF